MTASMSNPQPPSIIKLLQQDPFSKRYSGEEQVYSASTFSQQCDDAMSISNITNRPEQIAFVRSLVPDTHVSRMMSENCFNVVLLQNDYTQFCNNFESLWILTK